MFAALLSLLQMNLFLPTDEAETEFVDPSTTSRDSGTVPSIRQKPPDREKGLQLATRPKIKGGPPSEYSLVRCKNAMGT